MRIITTGGRGFIGSHFVELCINRGYTVTDIDYMGYCSNAELPFDNHPNYKHEKQDICDIKHIPSCDVLVNFAAETHVDNSINDTAPFVRSNILGVHNLLEILRGKNSYERPLFVQISTDEVYGDLLSGEFTEKDTLKPSNPYSATKVAAEALVLAYHRTYGLDYLITRSSNNYGERQYEEKLIPKTLNCIRTNRKIPIHGDGSYVRDWIYVKDNVDAIFNLIQKNIKNDTFNIGSGNRIKNIDVVKEILGWYNLDHNDYVQYVPNRWGQDVRYALNVEKINSTGWKPQHPKGIYRWFN